MTVDCGGISSSTPKLGIELHPYSESVIVYISSNFDEPEAFDTPCRFEGTLSAVFVNELDSGNGGCQQMVRLKST